MLAVAACAAAAAGQSPGAEVQFAPGRRVALFADPTPKFTRVRAPDEALRIDAPLSTISVTYNGFTPEAQAAFQRAVDILQTQVSSPVTITVVANWKPLASGLLGSAGPEDLVRDFAGAPLSGTFYPIALANRLAGTDLVPGSADVEANFNSALSEWYYGTDGNTPAGRYDFVSVVLHELLHGLGFSGSMDVVGGVGDWGYQSGGLFYPDIYDRSAATDSGQLLIDTAIFPAPSVALGLQLTSGQVYWDGANGKAANGGVRPRLYAPSPWRDGSSFSHLDESTYPAGNSQSLMTPILGTAEAIHSPGTIALGMLEDIGWDTSCSYVVSPTSLSFSASGGSSSVGVTATAGCAWTATSGASWLSITSGSSGSGHGTVALRAAANTAASSRSGSLTVAGQTVTISQQGFVDSDGDGLPDSWESQFGLSSASITGTDGANGDPDGDGVTNLSEYQGSTDPTIPNVWNLSEGATGFFTYRIAVANPGTDDAAFTVTFLPESGSSITQTFTLAAQRRTTITVNNVSGLSNAAVSAVLTTTRGGIVVERTMLWDGRDGSLYGGHTGKGIPQARTEWYLAEGEASFFDTYILFANANSAPAAVTVAFLLETGQTVTASYTVGANARLTVHANSIAALQGRAFSTTVTSSLPITVERAMYFGNSVRLFNGGHEAAAVAGPATSWFVAEGRTGPFFDMYLLLANPGTSAATATITFLLPGGGTVVQTRTLNPTSRTTIHVDSIAGLADTDVSASISATQPIIVERAMYWPDPFTSWHEAHNSAGVTATGTRWALAEGEVGGALAFETYVLVANPNGAAATVTLTFLRSSASPVTLTRTVAANGRLTVSAAEAGLASGERFGVVVDATQPVAVERAMYWNGGGQFWSAGTNETAVKLR